MQLSPFFRWHAPSSGSAQQQAAPQSALIDAAAIGPNRNAGKKIIGAENSADYFFGNAQSEILFVAAALNGIALLLCISVASIAICDAALPDAQRAPGVMRDCKRAGAVAAVAKNNLQINYLKTKLELLEECGSEGG